MIDKMDWVIVPVSNVDGYVYTWNVRITNYNYLYCVSSFHYTLILNTIPRHLPSITIFTADITNLYHPPLLSLPFASSGKSSPN